MTAQTTAERNRLAATRKVAVENLEVVADQMRRFLDPENNDFLCPAEIRADESVQVILNEMLQGLHVTRMVLRLERQCIRCQAVLPMDEIQYGYCDKH